MSNQAVKHTLALWYIPFLPVNTAKQAKVGSPEQADAKCVEMTYVIEAYCKA